MYYMCVYVCISIYTQRMFSKVDSFYARVTEDVLKYCSNLVWLLASDWRSLENILERVTASNYSFLIFYIKHTHSIHRGGPSMRPYTTLRFASTRCVWIFCNMSIIHFDSPLLYLTTISLPLLLLLLLLSMYSTPSLSLLYNIAT